MASISQHSKFPRPNRGWLLGAAGMIFEWILEHIDAPFWMAILTLLLLLVAAFLWDWLEASKGRITAFRILAIAYPFILTVAYFWPLVMPVRPLSHKLLTMDEIRDSLPKSAADGIPESPDLIADFLGPADLSLVISNQERPSAHQPTFQTALVDEDNMSAGLLPIGRQTGNYLRGHASLYRIPLLHYGNDATLRLIKPGDRIVGFIALSCDDCKRIRWYWIYYENTISGWYAESNSQIDGPTLYDVTQRKDGFDLMEFLYRGV
jgi:hypothetical protein